MIDEKFVIRKVKPKDAKSLLNAGFHFGKDTLKPPLLDKFGQYMRLLHQQTGFVVYNKIDKIAVGFLSLKKQSFSIQSIRYVYLNPDFRRRGLASKLILYALSYAEQEGAKKFFLTSNPTGPVTDLYKRLGFKQIINSQVVWGGGKTPKVHNGTKNILSPLNIKSKRDLNLLFKIYYKCMGKNWITFFENDVNNFIFGYSQEFKNFFCRSVYISKKKDSFVIIYTRPFRHVATVHLFISDGTIIRLIFEELMKLFNQKKIKYSKIVIFNVNNNCCQNLLKKYNFYPYTTVFLGKNHGVLKI